MAGVPHASPRVERVPPGPAAPRRLPPIGGGLEDAAAPVAAASITGGAAGTLLNVVA
jgi:hypothetical protein